MCLCMHPSMRTHPHVRVWPGWRAKCGEIACRTVQVVCGLPHTTPVQPRTQPHANHTTSLQCRTTPAQVIRLVQTAMPLLTDGCILVLTLKQVAYSPTPDNQPARLIMEACIELGRRRRRPLTPGAGQSACQAAYCFTLQVYAPREPADLVPSDWLCWCSATSPSRHGHGRSSSRQLRSCTPA